VGCIEEEKRGGERGRRGKELSPPTSEGILA